MSTAATPAVDPTDLRTDAPSPAPDRLGPPRSRAARIGAFIRRDLVRQLRLVESVFFIAVLPTALFLMFGTLSGDWSQIEVGHGNVMATTMTSMALYGAVTATTSIAGSAAVERQLGWGRQLSLTAVTGRDYILGKIAVALGIAVLPVALVMAVGAAVGAQIDGPGRWAATAALVLLGALPFALYGLAAALLFRSEAAVSAASGLLVVFGFLGNLFTPLDGVILDIARFTPLYGAGTLARWPQLEGTVLGQMGPSETPDPLWGALLNFGTWTAVFALLCVVALRRRTSR